MPKTIAGKDSGIKKFIKENKSLAFMLPVLAVLAIVLIIVYSGGGKAKNTSVNSPTPKPSSSAISTPTADQPKVEVLPQTERTNDQADQVTQDGQNVVPAQDPFKTPMKLTGVLIYSNEDATAIIEYGGVSYIVSKDDTIGDTTWKVISIDESSVMLDQDGKGTILEISEGPAIPVSAEANSNNTDTVTMRIQNADVRDVISAIAVDMGYTVIFTGEPVQVADFKVAYLSPEDALSVLLKSVGLDYIKNGKTMIVGTKELLTTEYFDNIALTKFSLKYIQSDVISSQIDALGIVVQKLTLDTNPYAIWIQGLPQELGKVRELIAMLDKAENAQAQSGAVSSSKLTPVELTYITADQMNSVLMEIGLEAGLILDSNPKTLYVYANADQLSLINELKKKLDVAANQQGSDSVISSRKLQFVKVSEIVPIISQFGLDVDVITLDRIAMTIWLKGDAETISQVSALIDKIDTQQNLDDGRFFIKKMTNITALEADTRLKLLNIPEITTYTFSYPQFAKSILVVCPADYQLIVKNYLNEMDVVTDKIKIPIDYSDEPSGSSLLAARRDLIVTLTGIPATSFTISQNVSRTATPHYVLILEETQEKIKMVQDLITKIDTPLSN